MSELNARIGRSYSVAEAGVRVHASAHRGASMGRDLANWTPFRGSADADLLPDLPTLVPRSRDITRNNGVASGIQQTLRDNIVGPNGLRLVATPDYRALGRDKEWAHEWAEQVEALWRPWAESTDCEVTGCLNFAGATTQLFTGAMVNGDGLALPLWMPDGRSRFALKLQVIESDRLSNPDDKMDSDKLRGGIEINEYGRPLAYYIRRTHPGDVYGYLGWNSNLIGNWDRIEAETSWGRKRVIHVHDRERSGQTRGKPILTPILADFKLKDHYQRTELQAAIVNALIAAFIETPLDSQNIAQMFGGDTNSTEFQQYLSDRREYLAQLKGGAIIPTYPGDKITPFTPGRPAAAFSSFIEALDRQMGAGVNLPYELLLKDFSKTNYSSARAALLEAWRFFLGRRNWLTTYWASPVYTLWLEEAVNRGLIEAPGFYENRTSYCRAKWIGAGRGWIDPVKEAQAAQLRMDAMVSTLEDECAEQGKDWEEILEQRAREQQRIRELGIEVVAAKAQPGAGDPQEQAA
jgi:lambda family phage portal protein